MRYTTCSISILLGLLALSGCTMQEIQKFSYNTGSAVSCRHANDNLPNEKQLDFDCLKNQGNDMSYEQYIEFKNELGDR